MMDTFIATSLIAQAHRPLKSMSELASPRIAMVAGETSGDCWPACCFDGMRGARWPGARLASAAVDGAPGFDAQWWPSDRLAVHGYSMRCRRLLSCCASARRCVRIAGRTGPTCSSASMPPISTWAWRPTCAKPASRPHFVCPRSGAWRANRVEKIAPRRRPCACISVRAGIACAPRHFRQLRGPSAGQRHPLVPDRKPPPRPSWAWRPTTPCWRAARQPFGRGSASASGSFRLQPLSAKRASYQNSSSCGACAAQKSEVARSRGVAHRCCRSSRPVARRVLAARDVQLIASGTTLEAAPFKRPMVIGYRMPPQLAPDAPRQLQPLGGFAHVPNIPCGDFVVPELIAADAANARGCSRGGHACAGASPMPRTNRRLAALEQRFHGAAP